MLEKPADVPTSNVREPAVAVLVVEERSAVIPQGLMRMHP